MNKHELKILLALTADTDPYVRKSARQDIEREFDRLTAKVADYETGLHMLSEVVGNVLARRDAE